MGLSDISVKRPVLAAVMSLVLVAVGLIAFTQLPLRELPDVDRPIVSVTTSYRGAAAETVENRITQLIEDQLAGVEGLSQIRSSSRDGRSSITLEFDVERDLDAAANDVRNAVARVSNRLPVDADPPQIEKTDADAEPIMFLNLTSTTMSPMELSDYAERNVVDRLSALPGVATIRLAGSQRPAMRVWLNPDALAARGLTPDDVDQSLRSQNVEFPAGVVESAQRDFSVRVNRTYRTVEDFRQMPITRAGAATAAVVRLGDVARIELAPEETRRLFRGNQTNQVGLGIIRQSKSNALEVAQAARAEADRIRPSLPEGSNILVSFDTTVFIDEAIKKVWQTLIEAMILVLVVIFLFLGTARAAFVPAAVIPVCLLGTFAALAAFGMSINLITLLALVLVIGLVVDDAIVMLENCQRRVDLGEPPLIAAQRGARQVQFAIISTTVVIVAVFAPLLMTGGFIGRLFVEMGVAISSAIVISAFAALTLTPMMCSLLLRPANKDRKIVRVIDNSFNAVRNSYRATLDLAFRTRWIAGAVMAAVVVLGGAMFMALPRDLAPVEDRGNLMINVSAPEGANFEYTRGVMLQAEPILMSYVESGEATRILLILPRFGDGGSRFNGGFMRVFLAPWDERDRPAQEIIDEMNRRLGAIPGAQFRVSMQQALGGGGGPGGGGGGDVAIVIGGADYKELAAAGEKVVAGLRDDPRFVRPRINYEPIAPRIEVDVDREKAAALGVSAQAVGRTLEAMMGSRRVTTFPDRGEEYDVILQTERSERENADQMDGFFVRSERTGQMVPLANLVTVRTIGDTDDRPRIDRLRSVTVQSNLAPGVTIGDALEVLEAGAREAISPGMQLSFTGASKEFRESGGAIGFAFALALLIVFLALAAQFESWVHPLTIMLTVPMAVAGGLFGLMAFGSSLNIYSQIGLIILIALAAKNGILIVEFANQLRDEGRTIRDAIVEAAELRLRPILMTSLATVAGAFPLIISSGAGAESRETIGVVIVFGVLVSTALTLLVVPVAYEMLARWTGSPEARAREIEAWESVHGTGADGGLEPVRPRPANAPIPPQAAE